MLKGLNTQVVEQTNGKANNTACMTRTMSGTNAEIMWDFIIHYQNNKIRKEMESKGIKFVSVAEKLKQKQQRLQSSSMLSNINTPQNETIEMDCTNTSQMQIDTVDDA